MYSIHDICIDDVVSLRIESIMREKGVTFDVLSERTGMSKTVIRKCLNRSTSITYERLVALAYGLRVEFRDLFRTTGWPQLLEKETCVNDSVRYEESKSVYQCIMSVVGCSMREAEAITKSSKPVTPSQYSAIAAELGDIAYLVMPCIAVKEADGCIYANEFAKFEKEIIEHLA